jgi:Ca2+-transporting ATPase
MTVERQDTKPPGSANGGEMSAAEGSSQATAGGNQADGADGANGDGWYALSPRAAAERLGVDPATGLSSARAARLLEQNGPNALPTEKPKPEWRRFLDEYRGYMQIILVFAGVVSLIIAEWGTAVLLFLLTVLNAVVGMREEGKAESAMNALKSMVKETARVRRDGTEAEIPAEKVVIGDVVLIAAGNQVPADGRIIEANALQIDESALSGESTPASKGFAALDRTGADEGDGHPAGHADGHPAGHADGYPPGQPGGHADGHSDGHAGLAPGDQANKAFMNTPVTHGSGAIVVTATGADTEVGKIAGMLSMTTAEKTPLTRQLNVMTLWIGAAALVAMVVMFALGLSRGLDSKVLFVTAVALAIAAIPEALPTVVQTILSLGAVDLAKRNAIVKDLASVDTLGSTSAINSDKTGTLTMNQMTVVEVTDLGDRYTVSGTGYGLDGKLHHAAGSAASAEDAIMPFIIASDAKLEDGKVVGDPTEGALLVLGHKAGLDIDQTRQQFPRLATLPFDPTYKLMATFNKVTGASGKNVVRCYVKGAAPAVLSRAASAFSSGTSVPADATMKKKAVAEIARMEGEGLRVMAAGFRDLDPKAFDATADLLGYVTGLEVTSLVGMVDPPREESKAAVANAQRAHIRVRMVTGDDVITGAAIATKLGIPGTSILGADFAALAEEERLARIDEIGVVGRVAPEHKRMIVQTLRKKGDVVAMTGDGVNDAPAIKAADIGIAMGTGTDVAKNAGRMILSDDNFATIVFAVEQGRKLFDNLTKYVRFILITLVAFVLTFLGASLFNISAGEPFTPVQILWVNFLIDTPLGIALGFDIMTPGLMLLRPRSRDEPILTRSVLVTAGLVGLFMAACLLALLSFGKSHYHSMAVATSLALTAFAFFRIVSTFESRSPTGTTLTASTFDCKPINRIAAAEVVLALLACYWDALRRLLGTAPLTVRQLLLAIAPAVLLFALWEIAKLAARRRAPEVSALPAAGRTGKDTKQWTAADPSTSRS